VVWLVVDESTVEKRFLKSWKDRDVTGFTKQAQKTLNQLAKIDS
jgi:hypothetical protein